MKNHILKRFYLYFGTNYDIIKKMKFKIKLYRYCYLKIQK